MDTSWKKAQAWEQNWWSNCINTLFEEEKQLIYADRMGLELVGGEKTPYVFDLHGVSVLDIGGGPVSILLKCVNVKGTVVDPCDYPQWVKDRYSLANIIFVRVKGEDLFPEFEGCRYDECWLYNCLQHVSNPRKIIENAKKVSKIIRIFEWIDIKPCPGHPQTLTEAELNEWLKGEGKVEQFNQRPLFGKAYYGVFLGEVK